jgi:hypothetical protein
MTITLMVTLDSLLCRKDHVLCVRCCKIEPIHLGDGMPARTYIAALEMMAIRHRTCLPPEVRTRKTSGPGLEKKVAQ